MIKSKLYIANELSETSNQILKSFNKNVDKISSIKGNTFKSNDVLKIKYLPFILV